MWAALPSQPLYLKDRGQREREREREGGESKEGQDMSEGQRLGGAAYRANTL